MGKITDKFKQILGIFLNVVFSIYPVLFFVLILIQKIPMRLFSLFIIAFAVCEFIYRITKKRDDKKPGSNIWNSVLLFAIGIFCLITNDMIIIRLSPVLMNIILMLNFGITLFNPPAMIYRFAILADKTIPDSPGQKQIAAYCYKVTVVWVVFFFINGCIAAWTVFFASDLIWFIYNFGLAYVLAGILFGCEYIVRRFVQKKIAKTVFDQEKQ